MGLKHHYAGKIRQGSENGADDLSLEANPPSLCSGKRVKPPRYSISLGVQ